MPTAIVVRALAIVLALLLCAAPAAAKDKAKITGVAVGFPTANGPDASVAKFGAWAPVYVSFEALGEVAEPAELVIEAPDPDEITAAFVVPVNLATDRTAVGYTRPNGATSEITVQLRTKSGSALSEPFRVKPRVREPLQYIVLALGGAPAGFELPRPAGSTDAGVLRGGRVDLTHLAGVAQLPDRWYGYEAADLVVLNTGTATDFVKQLFGADATPQNQKKREALIEWVRRGGRIVTSVGANAGGVAPLPSMEPLLPYRIRPDAPAREVPGLALVWPAGEKNSASGTLGARGGTFPVANLVPRPGKPARVLSPPPSDEEHPAVVVQAALGLGRVTLVAFDLDGPQLAQFAVRADYWDFVLRDAGANRASSGGDGKSRPPGAVTEEEDEAAVAMRVHNDTFDSVPVVSFGWVALFIVLYILLVGPVEYYVLKRVFGRLELTWVTFPIIVLSVSALAYYSASAVKGRDLKVNKLDVVDVDPESNRIYGTTRFTVFSPRIDSYSVGLTPGDGWSAEELPEGTVVSAVGAPRAGRVGLTRRRYFQRDEGLEGVPIQVWSTKSFSASWSAKLTGEGAAPKVTSDLVHPPGDRARVIGTFRHDLPVPELTNCVAFYAGQAYPLPGGLVLRNRPTRLVLVQGESAQEWLRANAELEPLLKRVQSYADRPGQKNVERQLQQQTSYSGPLPLTGMLFHETALRNDEGVVARNSSLRRLDQSWRLAEYHGQYARDEVIVLGRVAPPIGDAEGVLGGPDSPSKLWLKGLPGAVARRPVPGTARQETWVRFYVPVK